MYLDPGGIKPIQYMRAMGINLQLSSAFKLAISDWSPLQGLTLLTRADNDVRR